MATTIKKIIEVKPNDFLGNDRTIFLDELDREVYTFGKVQEGQSYEGTVSLDKRGALQFKKPPKEFNPGAPTAQPTIQPQQSALVPPTPPQTATSSTQRFEAAVTRFAAAVDQLTLYLEAQAKTPAITDEDIARAEEILGR